MDFLDFAEFRDKTRHFGPPSGFAYRRWQKMAGDKYAEKVAASRGGRVDFLLNAGVGSGKTVAVAGIASYILNRKVAERIVYVSPNRVIIDRAIETFNDFGIDLINWENGKFPYGEPVSKDGLAMTYASLVHNTELQRKLCRKPTALFLDEIHHLGDHFTWNGAAKDAYEDVVRTVIGFTGTPWRTDNREIPFVLYEAPTDGIKRYRPDASYTLGEAIRDKVCRRPCFIFLDAEVDIPFGKSRKVVRFRQDDGELLSLPEKLANRRLSGSVRRDTPSRGVALGRMIDECRRGGGFEKAIIFVGGDSSVAGQSGKDDAKHFLPAELVGLGIPRDKIVSVTCDDARAAAKIRDFGRSDKWILITIDMVSEGVDIPELKVALFLSTVTAGLKTIQRIGRVLRGEGHALIVMFEDPRYVETYREIEKDRKQFEILASDAAPRPDPKACEPRARVPSAALGLKAWEDFVGVHDSDHAHQLYEQIRERLEASGLPDDFGRIMNIIELSNSRLIDIDDLIGAEVA